MQRAARRITDEPAACERGISGALFAACAPAVPVRDGVPNEWIDCVAQSAAGHALRDADAADRTAAAATGMVGRRIG